MMINVWRRIGAHGSNGQRRNSISNHLAGHLVARPEFFPRRAFDPDMGMAAANGRRVAAELDRHLVGVAERVIGAKPVVLPRRRE